MKAIKWKVSEYSANATVGGVNLACLKHTTTRNKTRWYAIAYFRKLINAEMRYGPTRKTREEAKEDAIRLGREILLDTQTCLSAELENFGVEE